jgi:hypothetical protein
MLRVQMLPADALQAAVGMARLALAAMPRPSSSI